MELLKDFCISDIVISEEFSNTIPAERKRIRALDNLKNGSSRAEIIVNDDNVLIDGYCTYLAACERDMKHIDVLRGWVEVIEAIHYPGQRPFKWKVPPKLIGKIESGDQCMVIMAKGVKRVTVENVIRQQYTEHQSYRKVIKKCRRLKGGGIYGKGQERKETSKGDQTKIQQL